MRYDMADDEIKGFLQFVKTGEAETGFAREIMEAVDYAKMADPDFYHHYMMVRLHVISCHSVLRLWSKSHRHDASERCAVGLPLEEVQQLATEVIDN